MRQALVNENADLVAENQRYVMRITGSDKEGQDQLGNFIDPESKYPVLVTTSRLLSTGVDAQTCRLIVLDREVNSMTEFKQIVGRGTRVHEDTKKFFFTLIDFRGATSHFADPDFDGDPVQIYEPGEGDPITPPDDAPQGDDAIPPTPGEDETVVDQPGLPLPPGGPIRKIYVDGVGARILAERVEYLDENGKLVTESLRDFTKTALKKRFASLDDFLKRWKSAERKQAIIEELEAEGLALDAVADELGKNLDPFDLICHVAFDKKPLTRRERAENVKKRDVFDQVRATSPRRARRAARKISRRGRAQPRRRQRAEGDRPLYRYGQLVATHQAFGGKERLSRRPSTRCRTRSIRRPLRNHDRPHHRQIHSGHHAPGRRRRWRRAAHQPIVLDVFPQDHRRSGSGTRADQGRIIARRSPRSSSGATGRRTRRASPGRRCSISSTMSCSRR